MVVVDELEADLGVLGGEVDADLGGDDVVAAPVDEDRRRRRVQAHGVGGRLEAHQGGGAEHQAADPSAGLDVADRGQSTALGILQDARAELRVAVEHSIELAEKLATSSFRFARKVTAKLDDAAAGTLGNVEQLLGGAVKSARETTDNAAVLAHSAVAGIAGKSAQA